MSHSASQAAAFYREVAKTSILWTVRDDEGFPASLTSSGTRAMPFWSSQSRVERIIERVAAYGGFHPHEVTWEEFCSYWVPELAASGDLVGLN